MNEQQPQTETEYPTPWSQYSPHMLLDMAQHAGTAEMAHALLMAAQVQATLSLEWTLENRVAPTIASRP